MSNIRPVYIAVFLGRHSCSVRGKLAYEDRVSRGRQVVFEWLYYPATLTLALKFGTF
jgi:hypothetical protein